MVIELKISTITVEWRLTHISVVKNIPKINVHTQWNPVISRDFIALPIQIVGELPNHKHSAQLSLK